MKQTIFLVIGLLWLVIMQTSAQPAHENRSDRRLLESLLSRPGSSKLDRRTFRFSEGTRTDKFSYSFVAGGKAYRYSTHLRNIRGIDYVQIREDQVERVELQEEGFQTWKKTGKLIALTLRKPIVMERLDADADFAGSDSLFVVPLYVPNLSTVQYVELILARLDLGLRAFVSRSHGYTLDSVTSDYITIPFDEPSAGRADAQLAIARFPVTVAQYRLYCRQTKQPMPKPPRWGWRDDHPMVGISQEEALAFCDWLSEETGRNYRLPTESEWRIIGLAPVAEPALESVSIDLVAWWGENAGAMTHPVGQKLPNHWGVFDMAGNVWEWTQTREGDTAAIITGGSWDSHFEQCSPLYRTSLPVDLAQDDVGFRLVREPEDPG